LRKRVLENITRFFTEHPWLLAAIDWTKTHSLPGFHQTAIWDVGVFFWNEVQRDDLFIRAQAISFSFFLSLFPSLIALFTLVPLISGPLSAYIPGIEQYEDILYMEIQSIIPGSAGNTLFNFVKDIVTRPRFALFSFGFVLALFFSSNGMATLVRGFEKSYEQVFRQRSAVRRQVVAIALVFVLFFLSLISVIFIITGDLIIGWLIDMLNLQLLSTIGLYVVRWVVIVGLYYFGISFIYRYGAATHRRFSFFSPGTSVATILIILTSVAFSFYVDNFGAYNQLYGSIGAVMVIMLWIEINVLFLLIGYELNVSIAVNRDLKEKLPDTEHELTEVVDDEVSITG
jgi:membrane protein